MIDGHPASKKTIQVSREEWKRIGEKAGWLKSAMAPQWLEGMEADALAFLNFVAGKEAFPETKEGLAMAGGMDGIVKHLLTEENFGKFALKAFDTAEQREKVIRDFFAFRQHHQSRAGIAPIG